MFTPKIKLTEVNDTSDNDFNDPDFRVIIENHLERLKVLARDTVIKVAPVEALKYNYDYYSLLAYKGVSYQMHWITMRCNGRVNPYAEGLDIREIITPPVTEIQRLMSYHQLLNNKKIDKA